MAATYTYPGVYVEEIPSGVRPIAGVSTATAAFVDYFDRGPVDEARRLDNFGDVERVFGGLHTGSEGSYALQQYFLNGGSAAFAIRVLLAPEAGDNDDDGTPFTAINPAQVTLVDTGGIDSITITAACRTRTGELAECPGSWGNRLSVGVIHPDPADPDGFSLTVRLYDGAVLALSENYDNVNTRVGDASNVATVVNAVSSLVEVEVVTADTRPISAEEKALADLAGLQAARPTAAAAVVAAEGIQDARQAELGPLEDAVTAAIDAVVDPLLLVEQAALDLAKAATEAAIEAVLVGTPAVVTGRLDREAARNLAVVAIQDWIDAGGDEPGLIQARTDSQDLADATAAAAAAAPAAFEILTNEAEAVLAEVSAGFIGVGTTEADAVDAAVFALRAETDDLRTTLEGVRSTAGLDTGVANAQLLEVAAEAALAEARSVALINAETEQSVVDARGAVATKVAEITDAESSVLATQAALDKLDQEIRVAERATNIGELDDLGPDVLTALVGGSDGVRPGSGVWKAKASNAIVGSQADSTGLFALDDIAPQIFNIMSIPAAAELDEAGTSAVYAAALAYCKDTRAFLIVDPPRDMNNSAAVIGWGDRPIDENAALYFPRITLGDPLDENKPREFASSGTVAGIYARTDGDRGVFKAPAGTATTLRGTSLRLTHLLTDKQNGVLNVQGINVLRSLPIYNNVTWGARTLVGANAMASEWKYVPVRRTALYIEESLYQGLKWVVFEPNDEPLWGQIRLNVGAFMHGLFRQGAFQGTKPNDAYLVKCDAETTTQADVNAGVVNIVVGFAPLKPAEFVIIKLKQLAGQIQA